MMIKDSPNNTGEAGKSGMWGGKYRFCRFHRLSVGLRHDVMCDKTVGYDGVTVSKIA